MSVNLPEYLLDALASVSLTADEYRRLRAAVERWGVDSFHKGQAAERDEVYRKKLRETVTP